MRLKFATSLAVIIALLIPISTYAAGPKPGAKCTKAGLSQISNGKKYTCIKSGKKLIWDKGVETQKKQTNTNSESEIPTSVEKIAESANIDWGVVRNSDNGYLTPYNGPCSKEIHIQPQWVELIKAFEASGNCSGIYHLAKYVLGKQRPKTNLISNYLPIEQCKITESKESKALRGFYSDWESGRIAWTDKRRVPNAKMNVQVVPIYADDTAKPINSPYYDYGKFTNYIKEWIDYSADVGSNVEIRYPENYLKFEGKVSSYGLFHENRREHPGTIQFAKDLVKQVDKFIDFSNTDLVIVLVPAGTAFSNFGQATLPDLETNEGTIYVSTTENPYTFEGLGTYILSELLIPFWWIHELFHTGIGYADHYGDRKRSPFTEYGMGTWSLLTPWGGDLNGWEKWTLGFLSNNQVHCLDTSKPNSVWLAPTSVKSIERKVAIIPISRNKGIAIESVRAAGLYYKIQSSSQGVLVYEIDLTIMDPDLGLKLVLPKNRDAYSVRFFMDQATLKQGEFVQSNGFKITVVESGNFGDVVKVEKA